MNKYYVVKLKFSTRKYINKRLEQSGHRGCAIHGIAHIIIDKKGIVKKMIPEIIEGEYRLTDRNHIENLKNKGAYYGVKNIKVFRDMMGWNPDITKTKKDPRLILTHQEIKKMNKFFWSKKHKTTFSTSISYLEGSTPRGAEKEEKRRNPPIVIDDDEYLENYWNCNFTNSIKSFSNMHEGKKIEMEEILLEEINLKEYFQKFSTVEINNKKINPHYEFSKFNEWNLSGNEKNKWKNNTKNAPKYDKSKEIAGRIKRQKTLANKIINSKIPKIDTNNKHSILYNKLLRQEYKKNVKKEFENNNLSKKSLLDVGTPSIRWDLYQYAHIISFASLVNEGIKRKDIDKILDAISGSNCIRLSPNDHSKFDNNRITIDSIGHVYEYNDKKKKVIRSKRSISEKDLRDKKRKKFLERNYKYFQENKKNINNKKCFP